MPIKNVTGKAANLPVTTDINNDPCIRICGETSITGSRALTGDFAEITLSDSGWTDLTTPFTNILQLSVQNKSGTQIKVRPTPTAVAPTAGYVGIVLEDDEERNYNDLDTGFKVWGRSSSGSVVVNVEVLRNA
jgi:hypothetical protein